MPKKKKTKTNKNKPNPPPSGGDPISNAEETAQFLSVANSLLQHNDASFEALRTEVNQLRTQNLLQKQQHNIDIDELKGGKEHLQNHLDIANETTKTLQQQVVQLELEHAEHVKQTTLVHEQTQLSQTKDMNELRLELERLQRVSTKKRLTSSQLPLASLSQDAHNDTTLTLLTPRGSIFFLILLWFLWCPGKPNTVRVPR